MNYTKRLIRGPRRGSRGSSDYRCTGRTWKIVARVSIVVQPSRLFKVGPSEISDTGITVRDHRNTVSPVIIVAGKIIPWAVLVSITSGCAGIDGNDTISVAAQETGIAVIEQRGHRIAPG